MKTATNQENLANEGKMTSSTVDFVSRARRKNLSDLYDKAMKIADVREFKTFGDRSRFITRELCRVAFRQFMKSSGTDNFAVLEAAMLCQQDVTRNGRSVGRAYLNAFASL